MPILGFELRQDILSTIYWLTATKLKFQNSQNVKIENDQIREYKQNLQVLHSMRPIT